MKLFTNFYNEICMVLESPGSFREAMIDGLDYLGCCCESIIDGLGSPGGCCEAIWTFFYKIFMVLNSQEVAVKPFKHFSNEILIVLNLQDAHVKSFA